MRYMHGWCVTVVQSALLFLASFVGGRRPVLQTPVHEGPGESSDLSGGSAASYQLRRSFRSRRHPRAIHGASSV